MRRKPGKPKKYVIRLITPTEYQECKAFYEYCQTVLRLGKTIVKHCNEGARVGWYGKRLCNIGLTRGLCDYQYIVPVGKYHSLWIEMKRTDGYHRKKNPDQDEFIAILNAHGHCATYAYGWEDAVRILQAYRSGEL